MDKLDRQDLVWAVRRLPSNLKELMMEDEWVGRIFVGGGYLRSIVSGEQINDVDVFVPSREIGELIAYKLAEKKEDVYTTQNAFTVKGKMTIQIIHRWTFEKPEDVSNSFDFTVCCAVIYTENGGPVARWNSYSDSRFYT